MMLSSSLKPEFPGELTHLKLLNKHAEFIQNTREVLANLECLYNLTMYEEQVFISFRKCNVNCELSYLVMT